MNCNIRQWVMERPISLSLNRTWSRGSGRTQKGHLNELQIARFWWTDDFHKGTPFPPNFEFCNPLPFPHSNFNLSWRHASVVTPTCGNNITNYPQGSLYDHLHRSTSALSITFLLYHSYVLLFRRSKHRRKDFPILDVLENWVRVHLKAILTFRCRCSKPIECLSQ